MSASASKVANLHIAKSFQLDVGDPILYGKYKNKKGIIKGFRTDEKSGDPIVIVEPFPNESGRKQDQELKLFKIRYDQARADAAEQEKTAGIFEAPPGLLETYLKWAIPVYAGHVLHRAELARQSLMDDLKPIKEALDDLERSLRSVTRMVQSLSEGEVAQWTLYHHRQGVVLTSKIGVKHWGFGIKGEPRYIMTASDKRITFKKYSSPKSYEDTLAWVRARFAANMARLDSSLQYARRNPQEDGPGLVEATLLVKEARKYASKDKAYKTQAKTTIPISDKDLTSWRYWSTALDGIRKTHALLAEALTKAADDTKALYMWLDPYTVANSAAKYFGLDPARDIAPDEARKAARRPFNESDVLTILKRAGWTEINAALVFQGHQSRGGVWFEHKRLLEVDVPYWGRPQNVEQFKESLAEIERIARHEFQHVGQDMLKNLLGAKEELGLPSQSIRDMSRTPVGLPRDMKPGNPFQKLLRDDHAVQDVEFYTRLADEIGRFVRTTRHIPKDQWREAMRVWVAASPESQFNVGTQRIFRTREFFSALKRRQQGKWKKAVSEFVKGVNEAGVRIPSVNRVASLHLAQEALLPIMDPLFNVREFCKQLILLEDHLQIDGKRCLDCIRKHILAAEALAEEAISLDPHRRHYKVLQPLPAKMRVVWKLVQDKRYLEAAWACRKVRKPLMLLCSSVRVASEHLRLQRDYGAEETDGSPSIEA